MSRSTGPSLAVPGGLGYVTLAITGVFGKTPAPSAEIIYLGRSRFNLRK